jgi:guanylate kinase
MAFVVTLTGPSQCGKSTIQKFFIDRKSAKFKPVIFRKYTTRLPREAEDDIICVENIPLKCDLVYEQYGVRYGFRFDDLYEHFEKGESPIIVLNDVRAVEDVRTALWPQVISLFLYKQPPFKEVFFEEEEKRAKKNAEHAVISHTAQNRFDKANSIYRIYIENIYLFDHVVLNVGDLSYTEMQIEHIVTNLSQKTKELKVF